MPLRICLSLLAFLSCCAAAAQERVAASQPAAQAAQPVAQAADVVAQPDPAPDPQPAPTEKATPAVRLNRLDNFHVIESGRAYRSAQLTADKLRQVIQEHGICVVLNLRGANPQDEWYRDERRVCAELGVTMIDIPLSASELPSRENLLRLYDVFRNTREPLLMHCKGGADRSSMAAAMWRMTTQDVTAGEALDQVGLRFGHLRRVHPEMSQAVQMFVPDREWIEQFWPVP